MKSAKRLAAVLAVLMCLMTFGSCADNSNTPASPDASQAGGTSPAGQASPEGDTAPAQDEEVVLYVCTAWEESWWDPALFMSVSDANLSANIYENLVELQTDGSVLPQLAESWDISDDGLTCTFYLRQGVQWHKGYGEFTSADVKFTLERQSDPAVASVNAATCMSITSTRSIAPTTTPSSSTSSSPTSTC
jgi:peptide/nickel transport system substrate-binding protein